MADAQQCWWLKSEPQPMNVNYIIKDWLITNGYDGLYNDVAECGCDIDDLMVCNSAGVDTCLPAYKFDCRRCLRGCLEDYRYMMGTSRECPSFEPDGTEEQGQHDGE